MATVVERLELLITSSAKGAVAGLKETEAGAGALDQKAKGLTGTLQQMGITGATSGGIMAAGIAGGAIIAAGAIAKFALDGINHFVALTGEVRSLQRVMGGSAEDASRLAFAMREMGIDVGGTEKAIGILSRRIGEGKDTLGNFGVEVSKNVDGTVNLSNTIANIAERYQGLADVTQKNTLLAENFGRGYQALLPLLGRSRDEIKAMFEEAGKDHQIFTDADLKAGRDYQESMRAVHEAITGLQIEIARGLVPAITAIAGATTVAIHGLDDFGNAVASADKKLGGSGFLSGAFSSAFQVTGKLLGEVARGPGGTFGEWWKAQADKASQATDVLNAAQDRLIRLRADPNASPEKLAAAEQHLADAQQNAAAAGVHGASVMDQSAAATQALNDQETLLTGTYEQQIEVLDRKNNAIQSGYDLIFNAIHADEAARDALVNLYLTNKDVTASEDDKGRALTKTEEAMIKAAEAAGKNAEKDHEAEGAARAHAAGVDAQRAELEHLVGTLDPGSPLRVFLQGYIDQLNTTPPSKTTDFEANTENASAKVQRYLELLNNTNQISRAFVAAGGSGQGEFAGPYNGGPVVARQHGGYVPGGGQQAVPIIAHGGEYVLSSDVVNRIKMGRPSRGANVWSPLAGGGATEAGPIVIQIPLNGRVIAEATVSELNRAGGPKVSARAVV